MLSKKQAQILETGHRLFWKYGFKRVTVEELCRESGVSKMTFYRYYPDKITLAKAVFDREVEKSILRFREIMAADDSPDEKIRQILLMKSDSVSGISKEFLKDFYADNDIGLGAYIAEKTSIVWNEIILDFKAAQDKGIFRTDFKPELMLYLSQKLIDIMSDEYLISLFGSPENTVMELARFFTYGISPMASREKC